MTKLEFQKIYYSKLKPLNNRTQKILKSDKFLLFSIAIFSIVALIQISLFASGIISQNNMGFPEDWPIWLPIANLSLQVIGGFLSIVSFAKGQRLDKDFYKWAAPAIIVYIINSVMLRLWFKVVTLIIMLIIRTWQHVSWNKESNKDKKIIATKWYYNASFIIGAVAVGALLGWAMSQIPKGSAFENPAPYPDAILFSITVISQFLLIKKNLFYHFPSIIVVAGNAIVLLMLGQYMTFVKMQITIITSIFGMFFWQATYLKEKLEDRKDGIPLIKKTVES